MMTFYHFEMIDGSLFEMIDDVHFERIDDLSFRNVIQIYCRVIARPPFLFDMILWRLIADFYVDLS